MRNLIRFHVPVVTLCLLSAVVVSLVGVEAEARDLYQDRRGFFLGLGIGGGGVTVDDDVRPYVLGDVQLGGGVTRNFTVNLDVDVSYQYLEDWRNWVYAFGPEFTYFFPVPFYIRAGIGMAVVDQNVRSTATGKDSVVVGFDGNFGIGYEFFLDSDVAFDFGVEGDYIFKEGSDLITYGFVFGMRFY